LAPLRYGAGVKGKIAQCLAAGLPVVTTPIGADGLDGLDECVLIADDSAELAAQAVRVYRDDSLWRDLSQAGQELVKTHCSFAVLAERLRTLLDEVGSGAAPSSVRSSSKARPE
jgi:glycosyltransferase involved in cell wall biosynthesis